ncbi:MAG: hypothetical protein BIFFINMI_00958 [Phycisphaerae bacterium]|nr:hypothetical protein [Phycisphaerae bacterium]
MTFTYASVCDGIGAVHVAWQPLGWRCAWVSEIEPFADAVVERRWGFDNLGDMTEISEGSVRGRTRIDLLVGGTPCQSFSVAGLRKGLADPRGNLALVFLRLVDLLRPQWVVWENVPGVLSSGRGRDFGCFLGALGQLGYGFAWRVLDAQFFGVPQRRRRVFVVGHVGDWRPAVAVLLEPEGLCRNPAAGRGARAEVARAVTCSSGSVGGGGHSNERTLVRADGRPLNALCYGGGNTSGEIEVATTLTHHGIRQDFDTETFAVVGPLCAHSPEHGHAMTTQQAVEAGHIVTHPLTARHDSSPDGTGRGVPIVPVAFDSKRNPVPSRMAPALRAMGHDSSRANAGGQVAVAYQCHGGNVGPMGTLRTGNGNVTSGVPFTFQPRVGRSGRGMPSDVVPALAGGSAGTGATSDMRPCVVAQYAVRRLTPRECERLQGFPDDYTLVPFRGKPAADGPRYRALGNSMAVPVMAWIGRRIAMVDAILAGEESAA